MLCQACFCLLLPVSFMIFGSPVSWRGLCSYARAPAVAMPPPAEQSPCGLFTAQELSAVLTPGLLLPFGLAGPLKLPPSSNSIRKDIFSYLPVISDYVSPRWSLWRHARQSNASANTNGAAALTRSHAALSLAEAAA